MKTLPYFCLLLDCFLRFSPSFSQPFVQTFHDFEPNLGIDGLIDFGFGVSTSVNGDWAVVGATSSYDVNGGNFRELAGAAYLYHRNPKFGWNFFQKIVPTDRSTRDLFGDQVAIYQDHLIVSAIWDDDPGSPISQQKGSIYLFGLDTAGVWQEAQKLLASDASDGDYFGEAIDLGAGVAMVGVPRKDFDAGGGSIFAESGAVYVFTQDNSGLWSETQKLLPITMNSFDQFGTSVSIQGEWAAVGVPREDQDAQGNILTDAGAVYLYQRDSSSSWQLYQLGLSCFTYLPPARNWSSKQ
ncbi:MAG: FG-GAP repeat protein, partial [Bacteroidota bacterium]